MTKKRCLIAALAVMGALAAPAVASAHIITSSSLSCNQLDFSYEYFSSGRENVTLTWDVGTQVIATQTVQTNGPSGNITVSPPDLSGYQGDTVTVTGTWTYDGGGSFSDSVIAYCTSPSSPDSPTVVQGPQGPVGPQGPAGPQGPTGQTGANGSPGPTVQDKLSGTRVAVGATSRSVRTKHARRHGGKRRRPAK